MRGLLLFLSVCLLLSTVESWGRFRWRNRKAWGVVKRVAKDYAIKKALAAAAAALGKRDLSELDTNNDGDIDDAEFESFLKQQNLDLE